MPKYDQAFNEVCRLANSGRVTDKKMRVPMEKCKSVKSVAKTNKANAKEKVEKKKKSMTKLGELYECKDAVKELDENSKNKREPTWSTIMHTVHNVLKYEADKATSADDKRSQSASTSRLLKTKDAKDSMIKNDYSPCILETIKKANSFAILLKCKHIVSLVLEIFLDKRYIAYRKIYLTILMNHVLLVKQYQTDMTYQHYKELLKVAFVLYDDAAQSCLDKNTILQAICALVQHGCRQSHLALRLKNNLPFLVKVFQDAKADPKDLSESAFELANVVCEQIGAESRMAVCEFGETVMRLAVDLNCSFAKYDWILLIVRAHHPGSVTKGHDAAYACDWQKWTDLLRLIYCRAINDCKSEFASDSFIQLACEVAWQLKDDHTCIDDHITIDESCYFQPSKRRKIVIGIQAMIDILTTSSLREYEQSIKILIVLVMKYPESIRGSNFLQLMEFLVDYLSKCQDKDVLDKLWELGKVMVELESKSSSCSTENEVTYEWDKLWDITLRSLGTNKNEEKIHELLQSLIKHKKVIDSNGVLNLYLKKTIVWSKLSIRTLLVFCKDNLLQNFIGLSPSENNLISNDEKPIQVRLLRWILAAPKDKWNAQYPVEDVCELLVGLTLKSWYNNDQSNVPSVSQQLRSEKSTNANSKTENSLDGKNLRCGSITDIERIHLLTVFEGNSFDETVEKKVSYNEKLKGNVMQVKEYRDLLINDLIEQNVEISESEPTNAFIMQTIVIAKVISNLERLKLAQVNIKETLNKVVKNLLAEVFLTIDELSDSKKKSKWNNLCNILETLRLLYETRYENEITEVILASTNFELLSKILRLTKVEITNDESAMGDHNTSVAYVMNIDHLSERHKLSTKNNDFQEMNPLFDQTNVKLKACVILSTFCAMIEGDVMSDMQEKLQLTLLNPDHYHLEETCDFNMAVRVLEILLDSKLVYFSEDIAVRFLEMLQELCGIWHKDEEAARKILNILPKLFVRLGSSEGVNQRQASLHILASFHKLLQDNKYGPMTYLTFVKCLKTIARIDPDFSWAIWKCGTGSEHGNETPVVQEVLAYIESPFHVVRLEAINCLRTIFTSNNVNLEWLREFFSKLGRAMNNLFIVKQELEQTVKADERENRIASSLHIIAVVVSCSAIFRSEALLSVFRLAVDKKFNSEIVNKVLDKSEKSLKMKPPNSLVENNLNYLITHWLDDGRCLDEFPMSLARCKTDKEFYQKYIGIIVPVIVQKGSLQDVKDLCNEFDISFEQAIENSFPRLISWLLPHVSLDPPLPSGDITIIDIRHATEVFHKLHRNENELETIQKMSVLIGSNLESIILTMIKRLHDEKHSSRFLTIAVNYPSFDPPHFKHGDMERSFKYLQEKLIGTDSSLAYILATEKQDVLQKVLLNLKSSIQTSNSVEHKLKALHQYVYFSMMMLEEIQQKYFDEMAAYIIRDISHTLVHLMNESSDLICQAACSYLFHLLKQMLPSRHREIQQNLRLIITGIIPIVKTGRADNASDVMNFLVVQRNDLLGDAIERLDSFPVDEVFQEAREIQSNLTHKTRQEKCLENEIQHFLNIRAEGEDNCSVAELERLAEQLSKNKTGLKDLYQKLGSVQRFSEDCASSILHQLICALVKLTTSSDRDISLRAVKTLGELGPADLSTMILQPEKDYTTKPIADPMLTLTYRVVVLLSNFLIHSDVELFTVTSEALYVIMSSSWGQKVSVEKNSYERKSQFEISQEILRIEYIRPFIGKSNRKKNNTVAVDETKFADRSSENREIWTGKLDGSHSDWITNITCHILNCFSGSYLSCLIPVCRANVSFCETILPWIIHLILYTEDKLESKIYDCINRFFDFYFMNSGKVKKNLSQSNEQKNTCFNYSSIRCMLNVVDFIRSQSKNKCRFELNYLHIAKAAQYCSAYFTSVLYAELWCEQFLRECSTTEYLTPIDYVCEIEPDNGKVLQEILKEAFIKIGDPDAIYGCGTSYFQNPTAKIEHYVQLRKWDKVLLTHDIELSHGNKTVTKGLLDALQHSGLQYLLGAFARTIKDDKQEIDDIHEYECAWRLSDWNMPTSERIMNLRQNNCVDFSSIVSNDYPLFHYHALKSFHENDKDGLRIALESARVSIIKTLRNISLESCKTVYPVLSQLQMLGEIEEMYFAKPNEYNLLLEKWRSQDSIRVNDFEYAEPILTQRTVFLEANRLIEHSVVKNALTDTYLRVSELSQKDGYFQIAARALGSLSKQVNLSAETTNVLQHEEAMLAWMSGDHELGRHLLHNLIAKDSLNLEIRAQALNTYGNWMAETKSENPQKVISKYYLESLKCSEKIKNPTEKSKKNTLQTNAALAQFADVQYQQILTYMKSPQFESFKECVAYSEKMADKLAVSQKNIDEKRAAHLNKIQCTNDMAELENIEKEKNLYLLLALKHYIITLKQGEDHNLLMFRLVSLWLDNTHHGDLCELLESQLNNIPSHKFILLVPQLAPHITTNTDDIFSVQIYNLLRRCALEHPHHTLPVLFSLMNSYKDKEFDKSKSKTSNCPEPRVIAAKKLIDNLATTNIKPIIQEMHQLDYSLIMLANLEIGKITAQQFPVPNVSNSVVRIKNFEHSLIPTLSIDVEPNKIYNRVVSVRKYDTVFNFVGGVNAPKKITCHGTDGIRRDQLVKGKDDLRQDAVMQQVFTVMNILLKTSKEAIKRKLSVRTYKVVPLSQRCGILEWCNNTMPIGTILEGSQGTIGLHVKYYPKDWTPKDCRKKMTLVFKKSNSEKLRAFMDCCKNLHPVFHYFFLENFSSPEIWFERRLAYVHSVATTSIIGYILGLGDRHVNNILIDKSTAELVHIDFGIAFEQGKVLPTPETVPFRLTRDIEAAMGVSGVEGVLRRSCEETMTVLRHHRKVLITLLQVLLYDPLVSWAITPAKAYSIQKGEVQWSSERGEVFGETNKLAERALLRLDQKLQGTEEGSASSVAGQVERLIQSARDPANLSRLYFGWQSYL